MKKCRKRWPTALRRSLLPGAGLALLLLAGTPASSHAAAPASVIVQATNAADAAALVRAVGGAVTHELGIIRAVAAEVTPEQRLELALRPGIRRVWESHEVLLSAKGGKGGGGVSEVVDTYYPTHLGADSLHLSGITGSGVTIAVIDSGVFGDNGLTKSLSGSDRILADYDARTDTVEPGNSINEDPHGHGSHVTSVAISSRETSWGGYNGMAPGADLVTVVAFDAYGAGTYADVIRGIDWVVANKEAYGIRVLNCSFSAEPQSYYWDDPLNQAVMEAWRAGIVVVASAGNRGPDAMTIGVPGNVPYVVTVGAMSDNFTPEDPSDDILASFSSAGPTVEGFVKPEIVAPGGHVKGLMKSTAQIAQDHPEFHDGGYYFNMSGTSQATAVVTGTVALMLQHSPQLTPDEVKRRLMVTADGASFAGGSPVYSIFQQGAGRVDAFEATHTTADGTANRGLDIDADLAGTQHYRGPADAYTKKKGGYTFFVRDADGNPVEDDGFLWSDQYAFQDGFLWSDGMLWSDGLLWSDGMLWSDGFVWSDGFLWSDGMLWSDLYTEALFTESWVPQE